MNLQDLQALITNTETTHESNNTVRNSAFLNIYLNSGDLKLQLTGIGLENAIASKFNSKNQKAFFTKLLEASKSLADGEIKEILKGTVSLELLKVGKEADVTVTSSMLNLLDV